jgi:hypothetical protein
MTLKHINIQKIFLDNISELQLNRPQEIAPEKHFSSLLFFMIESEASFLL